MLAPKNNHSIALSWPISVRRVTGATAIAGRSLTPPWRSCRSTASGSPCGLAGRNAELTSHWVVNSPWYEHWDKHYNRPSVNQRKAYFDLLAAHHDLKPILNFHFWNLFREPGRGLVLKLVVPPDLPSSTTLASPEFRRRWIAEFPRGPLWTCPL